MPRNETNNRFEVGDIICKGGAYMTQGKVLSVRDAADGDVIYTVATHNRRIAEWTGSTWAFADPSVQAEYLRRKSDYLLDRAGRIEGRILRTKAVV